MRHDSVAAILARSPADDPRRAGRAEGISPVPETGENKEFQHARTWVVRVTDPQSGDDAFRDEVPDPGFTTFPFSGAGGRGNRW